MWTTEHTQETDLSPRAIWTALRDLHEGRTDAFAADGFEADTFELHGPFAVGTELSVTPAGQETFGSTIVELQPERRYADRTDFGDVTLTFAHTLDPLPAGGTRITHRLEISGAAADTVGPELGPQISDDFPAGMTALIAAARRSPAVSSGLTP